MEQRLEVCSLVLKENPKVSKVKLFQYAGVKRSTFYSQKEKGLPIAPMGSKGRRPTDYGYDVHGNMVMNASIRKALHDYSGGAGFKRDSFHRFAGHRWSVNTVIKMDILCINVG